MSNERDTHFQGFAELLHTELQDIMASGYPIDVTFRKQQQLIAQRAYDLVYFLLDKAPYHSGSFDTGYGTPEEIAETIEHLPDLTEWPTTAD